MGWPIGFLLLKKSQVGMRYYNRNTFCADVIFREMAAVGVAVGVAGGEGQTFDDLFQKAEREPKSFCHLTITGEYLTITGEYLTITGEYLTITGEYPKFAEKLASTN